MIGLFADMNGKRRANNAFKNVIRIKNRSRLITTVEKKPMGRI
jgi:hypothetical protein